MGTYFTLQYFLDSSAKKSIALGENCSVKKNIHSSIILCSSNFSPSLIQTDTNNAIFRFHVQKSTKTLFKNQHL